MVRVDVRECLVESMIDHTTFTGSFEGLFTNPAPDFTMGFLGCRKTIDVFLVVFDNEPGLKLFTVKQVITFLVWFELLFNLNLRDHF